MTHAFLNTNSAHVKMAEQEVAGSGWKFPESYDEVMDYVDKTDPNLLYCVLVIPWVPFYWNLVSVRFPKYLSQSANFVSFYCLAAIYSIVNHPTLGYLLSFKFT